MTRTPYGVQGAHDKDAYDFLDTGAPEYEDGRITALFYAALRLINQYFERRGLPIPERHGNRSRSVRYELPAISRSYDRLKSLGEQARYGGMHDIDGTAAESAPESYAEITRYLDRQSGY